MSTPTIPEITRYRVLSPFPRFFAILSSLLGLLTAAIYLFHLGVSLWGEYVVGTAYLHLILAFFLPLVFLYFPLSPRFHDKVPWYDFALAPLCFLSAFYFFLHGEDILFQGWEVSPPPAAWVLGILLWAFVLEAARRTVGGVLFLLVLLFSLYPLFAEHMPGLLSAKSFSFSRLVGYHVMGPEGVIGLPTRVLGTLFVGFMLFGVSLTNTGAAKFFLDFALSILGTVRGGTAKVAVVSSAMVGSVSGSVITNVITTGSFTIPAMKGAGYPNHYAAAIETCASTGGVLMPPIMGAAAFVMASILNITYAEVVLAAIIPSILYYLGLFIQVDSYAAKTGLRGLPRKDLPLLWQTVKAGWFYIFAFALLVYILFALRREAQAPFYATLAVLLLTMIKKETRLNARGLVHFVEKVGQTIGEIAAILAAIGLLIDSLLLTGVAQTLSSDIIDLAGGNIILLVGMGAAASFILGMGLTITACYLLLAVLLAPALVQSGLNPLAVHLFLMYCGMLSFITPPVAIAAYAAASLAGANAMKTGFQAIRLGVILFLIPFFFVFQPAFVLHGTGFEILKVLVTGFVGVILIASGLEGYLLGMGKLPPLQRTVSTVSGALLLTPEVTTDLIGAVLAGVLVSARFLRRRNPRFSHPNFS
jgi:TRAP transporter 4TM/12TM fusion protein